MASKVKQALERQEAQRREARRRDTVSAAARERWETADAKERSRIVAREFVAIGHANRLADLVGILDRLSSEPRADLIAFDLIEKLEDRLELIREDALRSFGTREKAESYRPELEEGPRRGS